jgi:hypothetical protein
MKQFIHGWIAACAVISLYQDGLGVERYIQRCRELDRPSHHGTDRLTGSGVCVLEYPP